MKQDPMTMTLLYDYYGALLSDKQQACFDLYYNQDFSLAEIAEQIGISRQGVHDSIARAEATLQQMEQVTGCIARADRIQQALAEIDRCAAQLLDMQDASVQQLARQISQAARSIKE